MSDKNKERCGACGQFVSREKCVTGASEDEIWLECLKCCSRGDYKEWEQKNDRP